LAILQAVQWLQVSLPQVEAARCAVLRLLWAYAPGSPDGSARLDHLLRTTPLLASLAPLLAQPLSCTTADFSSRAGNKNNTELHALHPPPPPYGVGPQLAALAVLQSQPAQRLAKVFADAAADETRYACVQIWLAMVEHAPALRPALLGCTLVGVYIYIYTYIHIYIYRYV